MDVHTMYNTINHPLPYHFSEYNDPHQYEDPKKQMMQRARLQKMKKFKQGKFKPTCKHKPCFMDEFIKTIKDYPAPNRYKLKEEGLNKRTKSLSSLNKVDLKTSKRTYIDDIQKQHNKFKHPGVGKYNLIDPEQKPNKIKRFYDEKIMHLDNIYNLADQVPGPGSHNPHLQVKKLKMNRTDYKFYKEKHAQEEKKLKRSISTGMSPFTYNPILYGTFDSIANNKKQEASRWSHGVIDKRKGIRSLMKFPSPAEYNLINQWEKADNHKGTIQQKGTVKLLDRCSKSARNFSIYQ